MKRLYITTVFIIFLFLGVRAQVVDVVTTGIDRPRDLYLVGNELYFSEYDATNGKISKINITDPVPIVQNVVTGLEGPSEIMQYGNDLYIFQDYIVTLSKIDITATNPVVTNVFAPMQDPAHMLLLNLESLIPVGNQIYFPGTSFMASSGIYRFNPNLNSPQLSRIGQHYQADPFSLSLEHFYSAVLDGSDMYFIQRFGDAPSKLVKSDISASNPVIQDVFVGGLNSPSGLERVGSIFYISDPQENKILKVDISDPTPVLETVASNLNSPNDLKVIGNELYFTQTLGNKISKIDISNDLSVNEVTANKVIIYPNPTTDYIHVKELNTSKAYKIYNILGMELMQGTISTNDVIDVSNFKNGMYFLKIEGYSQKKFIKK